ncbi:hypothetical protein [Sinorhizobium meliloti]|uniref:hypothetical protein n=1 Tax=Rhizobium meliloti TaxID=382 RepID=UPI000FE02CD9|nr:hypothetical protein [Sinorhizobium meliloti]MDX0469941.1 hypothetical protein [Sinorhizobium medicae]MDX0716522.1 hypothetical protein [Sinorhizobium medicae]MDX0846192.1 hypothetical protein [Sinorhizobium medicae]MDX1177081.1 hypothetical protein [Sinorhizobium medicae]MDX1250257.1 hypothetical protein [Sinorhizobium medicae]
MLQSRDHTNAVLPAGIDLLDTIFTELLMERGLPRDCQDAEFIASRLFSLYQSGVRDGDELRKLAAGG